jgi:hypothetical protein
MEGATDAEATAVARKAAAACGITAMNPEPEPPGLALADAAGAITASEAVLSSGHPYARSLGRFARTVTARYRALLAGLADDPAEPHRRFIAAMLSGDLAPLEAWLDIRHGPDGFARLFRAPSFDAVPEAVR